MSTIVLFNFKTTQLNWVYAESLQRQGALRSTKSCYFMSGKISFVSCKCNVWVEWDHDWSIELRLDVRLWDIYQMKYQFAIIGRLERLVAICMLWKVHRYKVIFRWQLWRMNRTYRNSCWSDSCHRWSYSAEGHFCRWMKIF